MRSLSHLTNTGLYLLIPLNNRIVVKPHYDAEKVYGLYMPDSGKNPMSQQGEVVAVGPQQAAIHIGDQVIYHPFVATPFRMNGTEYLYLTFEHLVGWLSPDGHIFPLPNYVLVRPEFPRHTEQITKAGLYIPDTWFERTVPVFGTVVRCGSGITEVKAGTRVVYPCHVGNEIGLDNGTIRQVFYTIRADDLLAVVED